MARDRGRERDEREDDRGRDRGDDRGRDRDIETGRREYGKIGTKLMDIYKHDQQQAKSRSRGGLDWYKLKEGWNRTRFLPSLDPDKPFYVMIKVHHQVGPDGEGFVYCPKTLGEDEECPICEYVELTVKEGKNKKEVAAATEMKASGAWLCQVLDRDEDDDQPMLFSFGAQSIYNGVMDLITGKYPDLLEFENGYDLDIKREGTTRTKTRYPSIVPSKDPVPVNPGVVDRMIDLNEYVTRRIFSVSELERILDGEDPMEVVNSRDDRGGDDRKEKKRDGDRDRGRRESKREPEPERARGRDDDDRPRGRGRDDDDDRHASGNRAPRRDDDDRDRDRDRDRDDRGRGREDDDARAADSRDRDRPRGRDRGDDRDRDREREAPSGRGRDADRDRGRGRGDDDDDRVAEEMDRLARDAGAGRSRR